VEERPLARLDEAEELDGVLSHLRVDEETDARAGGRQIAERLQRDVDQVADASDVDDETLGTLLRERAGKARDQRELPTRATALRTGASWR
jgi:hypothetical protein